MTDISTTSSNISDYSEESELASTEESSTLSLPEAPAEESNTSRMIIVALFVIFTIVLIIVGTYFLVRNMDNGYPDATEKTGVADVTGNGNYKTPPTLPLRPSSVPPSEEWCFRNHESNNFLLYVDNGTKASFCDVIMNVPEVNLNDSIIETLIARKNKVYLGARLVAGKVPIIEKELVDKVNQDGFDLSGIVAFVNFSVFPQIDKKLLGDIKNKLVMNSKKLVTLIELPSDTKDDVRYDWTSIKERPIIIRSPNMVRPELTCPADPQLQSGMAFLQRVFNSDKVPSRLDPFTTLEAVVSLQTTEETLEPYEVAAFSTYYDCFDQFFTNKSDGDCTNKNYSEWYDYEANQDTPDDRLPFPQKLVGFRFVAVIHEQETNFGRVGEKFCTDSFNWRTFYVKYNYPDEVTS